MLDGKMRENRIDLVHLFSAMKFHLSLNFMNGAFLVYIQTIASPSSLREFPGGITTGNLFMLTFHGKLFCPLRTEVYSQLLVQQNRNATPMPYDSGQTPGDKSQERAVASAESLVLLNTAYGCARIRNEMSIQENSNTRCLRCKC